MVSLVATFVKGETSGTAGKGKPLAPLAIGNSARTEILSISGASDETVLLANATDDFVILKAGGDCWVSIGVNAVAVAGEGFHLFEGEYGDALVYEGERVAVIAAADIKV